MFGLPEFITIFKVAPESICGTLFYSARRETRWTSAGFFQ